MTPQKGPLTVLAGATILISLLCFCLCIYHAQTHCSTTAAGIRTFYCTKEIIEEMCEPGFAVTASGAVQGFYFESSIICPLRPSATVSGVFGCLAVFGLIFFFCSIGPGRDLKTRIAALGGIGVLLLLISFALMIGDVGGHKVPDDERVKLNYSPGSYITNIVFAFITVVLVGFMTFFGYKAEGGTFSGSGMMIGSGVVIGSSVPNQQQENEQSDLSGDAIGVSGNGSQTRNGYTTFN